MRLPRHETCEPYGYLPRFIPTGSGISHTGSLTCRFTSLKGRGNEKTGYAMACTAPRPAMRPKTVALPSDVPVMYAAPWNPPMTSPAA